MTARLPSGSIRRISAADRFLARGVQDFSVAVPRRCAGYTRSIWATPARAIGGAKIPPPIAAQWSVDRETTTDGSYAGAAQAQF
jgi:hypothetical protein